MTKTDALDMPKLCTLGVEVIVQCIGHLLCTLGNKVQSIKSHMIPCTLIAVIPGQSQVGSPERCAV